MNFDLLIECKSTVTIFRIKRARVCKYQIVMEVITSDVLINKITVANWFILPCYGFLYFLVTHTVTCDMKT